jgi:hypothetical protein
VTGCARKAPGWLALLAFALAPCLAARALAGDVTRLDVSIPVFDPGLPKDPAQYRELEVFPRIRKIEAMFLPFVLRDTLEKSREWGPVRVVPEPDPAAELSVAGTILRSDGDTLQLRILATDASGRVWFDKAFSSTVTDANAPQGTAAGMSRFQPLYDRIATELVTARDALDENTLTHVADVSILRYATRLAPDAFAGYLKQNADGTIELLRLPARDDPMLARIRQVRSAEDVITDAIDGKFRELHGEIASVYDVWRSYRRKTLDYRAEDARHAQVTANDAPRGSYEQLLNTYDNYKYSRVTSQELDQLAVAFNNEVGPTIDKMEARVAEMQGWVDERYGDWQRILGELFDVQTEPEKPRSGTGETDH